MRNDRRVWRILALLGLLLFLIQVQAGGRYQDPPAHLNEILAAATKGLAALQQGRLDEAMTAVSEARKLAKASNKMKTTAPMQRASGRLAQAKGALRRGDTVKAAGLLEEVIAYLDEVKRSYE